MKVCMFVYNACQEDARLLKEARTLTAAGYDVHIIAHLTNETVAYQELDGFRIFRVALDPIYRKMLRLTSLPIRMALKLVGLLLEKPFQRSFEARRKDAANREVRQRGIIGLVRRNGYFVKEALKENPAYFLSVGWLLAAGSVLVFHVSHWMSRLLYRTIVHLLKLLPTAARYQSYIDYYCRGFGLARREPADIYHAHDLNALPVAWLSSRVMKGKLVYDSHELWLDRTRLKKRSRFNRFLVRAIELFLTRGTDAMIAASESYATLLSHRYNIPQPTVILNAPGYCPVERSRILRDELDIPKGDRILLYIGRITYYRGLEEVIQSIQYLRHCVLVMMGYEAAEYVAGLKKLITDQGVSDRVRFFGMVPYQEVVRCAASADIGVAIIKNAGLSYYYTSPNKVFQCMAAGLPVVASNFPDMKKVIEGYNLGVTCDPDNPGEIANAINYVLSDEDRYNEMRSNALEAAKIFNWENESKKLLALYQGLSDRTND